MTAELSAAVGFVRRLAGQTDDLLLERYRVGRDPAAFEELLRHYGPMVLRVGRRVLGNDHDAEEAFQNTFLKFVDRARAVRQGAALPGWLHRVATNEALRLRRRVAIRAVREQCAAALRAGRAGPLPDAGDWLALIDEEANRLPGHLRSAFVLCDLDGLTQADAAARAGCSRETISLRLRQAREQLGRRLRQQGYELPVLTALAAGLTAAGTTAQVPASLATALRTAAAVTRGGASRGRAAAGLLLALALSGAGAYALLTPGPAAPTPAVGGQAGAAAPAPPQPDPVVPAIERGVRFLKEQEGGRGHWENVAAFEALNMRGGPTCLALLALLNAGVPADDPVVSRALAFLRKKVEPQTTYVVGLQTMVFARVGDPQDRPRIQLNVRWLLKGRMLVNGQPGEWSYSPGIEAAGDGSNSQFAVLGLYDGLRAGATVDPEVWKSIRSMYLQAQQRDGGWGYNAARGTPTLTMTAAGLNGLFLRGHTDPEAIAKGLRWVGEHFTVQPRSHALYNLYGLARLGRNSGRREFGGHDWYREGRDYLLPLQKEDGSWSIPGQVTDQWPVVSTSFALLFLTEGRTPVLIRKFAHGPDETWDTTRSDARNLADFAGRELFKGQRLAWEVYDARPLGPGPLNPARLTAEVTDLRRSPVVYLTGRGPLRLTAAQEQILQATVADGGFLLIEAGNGDPEFARSVRTLLARLFPANPLRPLPADHPVWKTPAVVAPDPFALEAATVGGRLAVVVCPRPLANWWDEGFTPGGPGEPAFRLAGNLIAAATGLRPPPPR
jgi:RNA polymerase sigma factor (sigma-70 family)